MLFHLTVRGRIRREGHEAGYHGKSKQSCTYHNPELRAFWMEGWELGRENRTYDLGMGRHPSQAQPANTPPMFTSRFRRRKRTA